MRTTIAFTILCWSLASARVQIGKEVVLDIPITPSSFGGLEAPYCWTHVDPRQFGKPPVKYIEAHFDDFAVPTSCSLAVADGNGYEKEVYRGRGRRSDGDFWSLPVFDNTICFYLTCQQREHLSEVSFTIDKLVVGANAGEERRTLLRGGDAGSKHDRDLVVCGDSDFEPALSLSSTAMYETSKTVAFLITNIWQCTGFLIGDHMVMTAKHCFNDASGTAFDPNAITSTSATFMRESATASQTEINANTYAANIVEVISPTEDWVVFSLIPDASKGVPGTRFGYLEIETNFLPLDRELFIPQHPQNRYKEIAYQDSEEGGGSCNINNSWGGRYYYYQCDTQSGSSGSPVIDANTHKLIAIHTASAGCGDYGNSGIASSTFYNLVPNPGATTTTVPPPTTTTTTTTPPPPITTTTTSLPPPTTTTTTTTVTSPTTTTATTTVQPSTTTTTTTVQSPTTTTPPPATTSCTDAPNWRSNNGGKTCSWVAGKPSTRCNRSGSSNGTSMPASEACCVCQSP